MISFTAQSLYILDLFRPLILPSVVLPNSTPLGQPTNAELRDILHKRGLDPNSFRSLRVDADQANVDGEPATKRARFELDTQSRLAFPSIKGNMMRHTIFELDSDSDSVITGTSVQAQIGSDDEGYIREQLDIDIKTEESDNSIIYDDVKDADFVAPKDEEDSADEELIVGDDNLIRELEGSPRPHRSGCARRTRRN
ncbi:hypothetical protein B7463_g8426, partial [Scytalidium lignicola]